MEIGQSLADPCLFFNKDADGNLCLLAVLHVNVMALAGMQNLFNWLEEGVKKQFKLTCQGELKKYLGVHYF